MQGEGQYTYENGDIYKGPFVDGLRHGIGILITKGESGEGKTMRYDNDIIVESVPKIEEKNEDIKEKGKNEELKEEEK